MHHRRSWQLITFIIAGPLCGCVNANEIAMRLGKPPALAMNIRALETRRFDTKDETALLSTATQTMQDLGFIITESSLDGGVLTGAKDRDATEAGQVAGQIALTIIGAALGVYYRPVWDVNQRVHATIVAYQAENGSGTDVRAAFDRIILDTNGSRRAELITDESIYQEFFKKFGTALSLEAKPL